MNDEYYFIYLWACGWKKKQTNENCPYFISYFIYTNEILSKQFWNFQIESKSIAHILSAASLQSSTEMNSNTNTVNIKIVPKNNNNKTNCRDEYVLCNWNCIYFIEITNTAWHKLIRWHTHAHGGLVEWNGHMLHILWSLFRFCVFENLWIEYKGIHLYTHAHSDTCETISHFTRESEYRPNNSPFTAHTYTYTHAQRVWAWILFHQIWHI